MANLINYVEENIDVLFQPLQYSGKVSASMKLVQSNCLSVGTSTTLSSITSDILNYEGTAIAYRDNNTIKFSKAGTFYNLTLVDGSHYPIAEGDGFYVYSTNYPISPGLFVSGSSFQWATQDDYHYNINNGFNDTGDGIKKPYLINGQYTNPACTGHNGAETKVTMPAFRVDLEESSFHYTSPNYTSTVLSYNDLIANNYYIFLENDNGCKKDLITLLPIDLANLAEMQKTFRRQFKTFR